MRQVEIPGGTATLREPDDLTPRLKRIVRDAARAAGPAVGKLGGIGEDEEDSKRRSQDGARRLLESAMSGADWRRIREAQEASVVVSLASWTLDEPLPTLDTIQDLDTDLYDALLGALGGKPAPDGETDFSPSPDPESPTNGPSDSPGPSLDKATDQSTPSSTSDGSPSATDSSSPD